MRVSNYALGYASSKATGVSSLIPKAEPGVSPVLTSLRGSVTVEWRSDLIPTVNGIISCLQKFRCNGSLPVVDADSLYLCFVAPLEDGGDRDCVTTRPFRACNLESEARSTTEKKLFPFRREHRNILFYLRVLEDLTWWVLYKSRRK